MRCVPTCAVMDEGDAELAWARRQLRDRLTLMARHLTGAVDAMPQTEHGAPWNVQQWRYLGSAPWREDDGAVVYVHGFRHATMSMAGEPLAIAVPASPGWWPVGCGERTPRRSAPRGKLRLVS
ncbi:MAG TPA: hypothetical protein VJO12_12400 [Stellaceae bacterium]|nr:hypothetical protein [Stellaceae bacterium]